MPAVLTVVEALQTSKAKAVVDTEAIFKTGQPTPPAVIKAVREELLPLTTILSATVPEAKLLLDDAGIEVEYPKSPADVKILAAAVRKLGLEWVLIKREIFDEKTRMTTLFWVLCGEEDGVTKEVVGNRTFGNEGGMGVSYSIVGEWFCGEEGEREDADDDSCYCGRTGGWVVCEGGCGTGVSVCWCGCWGC